MLGYDARQSRRCIADARRWWKKKYYNCLAGMVYGESTLALQSMRLVVHEPCIDRPTGP